MGSASNKKEQTVALEKYTPSLNDYYRTKFANIVQKMSNSLPSKHVELIRRELDQLNIETEENTLEALKYAASLSVLIDLSLQGWIFEIDNGNLTLKMENENLDDKQKLRYRLSAERNAQFKSESIAAFIRKMEAIKKHEGRDVSIRNLFGDANLLIQYIYLYKPKKRCASHIFNWSQMNEISIQAISFLIFGDIFATPGPFHIKLCLEEICFI